MRHSNGPIPTVSSAAATIRANVGIKKDRWQGGDSIVELLNLTYEQKSLAAFLGLIGARP
jgi:hypothetical protein